MQESAKATVYLCFKNEQKMNELEMTVMTLVQNVSVLRVLNSAEYEKQVSKDPPHLVIAESAFLSGNTILKDGASNPDRSFTSFMVIGPGVHKDDYLDEVMTGKFQFFEVDLSEEAFHAAVKKALKFSLESKSASFVMKTIKANEHLMKVGDAADKIYILKRGKLQAYQTNTAGQKVVLGDIIPGEFVGEMAYFNSEPRVASVIAVTDSELVEIPIASFERVIYQKPAWSLKLVETLSKRLKKYMQSAR